MGGGGFGREREKRGESGVKWSGNEVRLSVLTSFLVIQMITLTYM